MYRNKHKGCRSGSRHNADSIWGFAATLQASRVTADQNCFVGIPTQPITDAFPRSSDLADQPMRLVGPWRDRGVAEQPIEFQFRDVVAFAGALLQCLVIQDGHVAA